MTDKPYTGRKIDKFTVFLGVLFVLMSTFAACKGQLKDGPQLDQSQPVFSEDIAPAEYDDTLNARLRITITAGASATGADMQRAEQLQHIAPAPAEADKPQPITAEDWYGVTPEDLPERLQGMYIPTVSDVVITAKMTWGESRGVWSLTEQAGDIQCALNRVDAKGYAMGRSLTYVVTYDDQFHGYNPGNPTTDDYGRDIIWLVKDVVTRWLNEKLGFENSGRILPPEFLWFEGDGKHNYFRDAYRSKDANNWGWTLPSPYEN